jgi:hypothetical protein
MSVCFVVIPLVAGSWPMISAAIVAAGAAMGYTAVSHMERAIEGQELLDMSDTSSQSIQRSVQLVMTDSQVVSDTLQRGESFALQNGAIRAEFHVDGRGACQVHISGQGVSEVQLETAGRELMDRVRQQFAYAKIMEELEGRGFAVQNQQVDESGSIRISVQRM